MTKTCPECGVSFETNYPRKTACSPLCAKSQKDKSRERWNQENKDKIKVYNKNTVTRRVENGKSKAYQQSRRASKAGYLDRFLERARREHPETDLTREYLESIFGDTCSVTGVDFQYGERMGKYIRNPYSPSIDRIDSNIPYMQGNVQIVLATVNLAKSDLTMEQFTEVWGKVLKSWSALTQGDY